MTLTAPSARVPARGSIRTTLLLLTLVPAAAMGAAWLITTTTTQAASDRNLILQGARQITTAFGQRMLDLQETNGLSLQDADLRSTAQVRAQETLQQSTLPITNLAVIDLNRNVLVAYNKALKNIDPDDPRMVQAWKTQNATITRAVSEIGQRTFDDLNLAANGFTGEIKVDGKPVTVLTSIVPGGEAVVVTTVDSQYVQKRVNAGLQRNLIFIVVTLLITTILGSLFTSRLINRIKRLAWAAKQVSDGNIETPIPQDGNDELNTLGQGLDKLKESLQIVLKQLT